MPSGFQQIGSEVGFSMRWRNGVTGPTFLGLGSQLGSARGQSLRKRRGWKWGPGYLHSAGQPVTVGFQSLQVAE